VSATDDLLRRVPPQDLAAEQSVLGAILLENKAINPAHAIINSEDFYRESHREIFRVMTDLAQRKRPVDAITLTDGLRVRGKLEAIGGPGYLAELANCVPTAANVAHYARIVREKSVLRRVAATATEIASAAFETQLDLRGFLAEADAKFIAASRMDIGDSPIPLGELIDQVVAEIGRGELAGLPSGLKALDDHLTGGGFMPGDLITCAAATSVGKTTFANNIITRYKRKGVLLFSAEMSREQLIRRMIAEQSQIDLGAISRRRPPMPNDWEWTKIRAAAEKLKDYPLEVVRYSRPTPADVWRESWLCLQKFDGTLDLIVVDYAQLMHPERADRRERRHDLEIGAVTGELKSLAIELKVPVVLLSQVNRATATANKNPGAESFEPELYNLRESGSLEQDSDVVIMLWEPTDKECRLPARKGEYEIHWKIAKQRNGVRTPLDPLVFIPNYTKFIG
jgi:replicative DNA helicase